MVRRIADVDWRAIEERLYAFSTATIARFASERADEACAFFAYDVDLPYFFPSFDTPTNALRMGKRNEQEAIDMRAKMLTIPHAWRGARAFSTSPLVLDYSASTGWFAYHHFAKIKVEELEDLEFAEDYPQDEHADDYSAGMTRIALWRLIERLIEGDSFKPLRLASPFRLGYEMHDEGLTVLRILNWPEVD